MDSTKNLQQKNWFNENVEQKESDKKDENTLERRFMSKICAKIISLMSIYRLSTSSSLPSSVSPPCGVNSVRICPGFALNCPFC